MSLTKDMLNFPSIMKSIQTAKAIPRSVVGLSSGVNFYNYKEIPDGPGVDQLKGILAVLPELSLKSGPWIAGGATRRLLQGESLDGGDIDLFCQRYSQFRQLSSALEDYETVFKSDNATSYLVNGLKVQVIKRTTYTSLEEVFKDFDFSVCQIATDGKVLALTSQAEMDVESRTLRMAPAGRVSKITLVSRMIKYLNYGFTPEPGLFGKIIKAGLDVSSSYKIFSAEESAIYNGEDDPSQIVENEDLTVEILQEVAKKMGLQAPNV